ncbi:MAG: IS66-like element accessory protein TnpA [Xanthobacteraceae bacterium]|jgi:transposase
MSERFDHTLEHTLESKGGECCDAGVVRRIELITGAGRRRRWSADEKARIVLESLKPGANVSEVARRHGLSPQQLFGWRREARGLIGAGEAAIAEPPALVPRDRARGARPTGGGAAQQRRTSREPTFAPVVIAATSPLSTCPPSPLADTTSTGRIEIAIGDAVVRVDGQVEASLLTAVLRAVRRAS